MRSPRQQGFNFVDLMFSLCIIGLLAGVVVPALADRAKEIDNRIKCSSNLRMVALAMKLYANEEPRTMSFPRTRYDQAAANDPKFYTNPDAEDPFGKNGPGPNDVTSAIYLLQRTQDITLNVFICPSTAAKPFSLPPGKNVLFFSNFKSQANVSYSSQNPYPMKSAIEHGFKFNDAIPADFPIMADMNPGVPELLTTKPDAAHEAIRKINSPNHGGDGQNVLFADGHVDWVASPFVGIQKNNIYLAGDVKMENAKPVIIGPPANADDSILLPVWDKAVEYPKVESVPDYTDRMAYEMSRKKSGPATRPN